MDNLYDRLKGNTPIWFMRQAGRYLPEYRKIRKSKKSFLDLCFSPDLASQISLQPINRFDFDFIILFSDILVIPHCLGQNVQFKENIGPILKPIKFRELSSSIENSMAKLSPVFDTLKILKKKKKEKKIIGFCGGPFTVLNYMIEGGTSKKHKKILEFIKKEDKAKCYIEKILEFSIEYLKRQIKSGADMLQIFDSWAGLLEPKEFEKFIIKPSIEISKEIKKSYPEIPLIFFPRGSKRKITKFIDEVKCDVISLDEITNDDIQNCKKKKIIIQGNLSPTILLKGGKPLIEEVRKILERLKDNSHIFNLSHGILPKTPIENVEKVIKIVRDNNELTKRTSINTKR